MPELGLSSTYDYSTATLNRKKSIFLVIGVNADQLTDYRLQERALAEQVTRDMIQHGI